MESARALTGAAYGVIATVDGEGAPRDFVTSGFTQEEHEAMEAWPDGHRLFGRLHGLGAPLRLPDLDAWMRALGCAPFPVPSGAFQAIPMTHRGTAAGGFFLGGKEGGFTDSDEKMLVLFAQQAAAALANARAHRAEEVEISAPGGKSVRALIDATPIRSGEEGPVERVVVTLQDLAPFEALARARAEFLGLVSHELRVPLAAIKGSAATALGDPRDPDRAELRQYLRIVEEQADRMAGLIGDLLDAGLIGAGMLSVDPAPQELAGIVERARTAFEAGGGNHAVTIDLPEDLPRVMADARRIAQVLGNLFANAARHSPESAPIRVAARRDGEEVEVSIVDAGAGIPPERLPHLFRRHDGVGAEAGESAAGAGLGLVICRGLVEAHGGRIRAESGGLGRGTRILFTLPALADLPVIFVSAYGGGDTIVRALEAGAADYVAKPYSSAGLAARVGLALRRRTAPDTFCLGELEIDREMRRVTMAGRPVRLIATEYRLLNARSLDAGWASSNEVLQRRVWGPGKGDAQAGRNALTNLLPQARRRRQEPAIHPRRAKHGLPHARTGPGVRTCVPRRHSNGPGTSMVRTAATWSGFSSGNQSSWRVSTCPFLPDPLHLRDRDEGHPERLDLCLGRDRAVDPQDVVGLESVDHVATGLPSSEVDVIDMTVPGPGVVPEDDVVGAGASIQGVAVEVAKQRVVALLAVEQVFVLTTPHPVIPGPAVEDVAAHVAVHPVIAPAAQERVLAVTQVDGVCPGFAGGPGALVLAAVEGVISGSAVEGVQAGVTVDEVVAIAAFDGVAVVLTGVVARPVVMRRIVPVGPVEAVAHQGVVAETALDGVGAETAGEQVVRQVLVPHERVVAGGAPPGDRPRRRLEQAARFGQVGWRISGRPPDRLSRGDVVRLERLQAAEMPVLRVRRPRHHHLLDIAVVDAEGVADLVLHSVEERLVRPVDVRIHPDVTFPPSLHKETAAPASEPVRNCHPADGDVGIGTAVGQTCEAEPRHLLPGGKSPLDEVVPRRVDRGF